MVFGLIIGAFGLISDIFYWAKFITCGIILSLKKILKSKRFDLYDYECEDQPEKIGLLAPHEEVDLESPLSERELEKFSDEIFFYGVNSKSEALVVRIARKCDGQSEAWLYLKLADGRIYQLERNEGYQRNPDGKCTAFTCGGLKMYPLCAMRRWRISYCGMLRERKHGKDMEPVFVKFTFIWTASSDVFDTMSDLDIKSTASAMAETKWNFLFPPTESLDKALNSYCQSGVMNGLVSIDEESEKEIYLFGERIRLLGQTSFLENSNFKVILGAIPQTGLFLHLEKATIPNLIKNLYYGFIVNPSSKMDIVEDGLIISKMSDNRKTDQNLTAMFKAGKQYELQGTVVGERIRLTTDETFDGILEMSEINFRIGEYNGFGFLLSGEIFNIPTKPKESEKRTATLTLKKARPLTIYFTEEESHLAELAGGKGSSLGKLTKLSNEMKSEFTVPKGIVITTEAYNRFLTSQIADKIENMKNVAYGNTEGKIQEACKTVQKSVESASLPKQLTEEIELKLKSLYQNNINDVKFAVRSSATGEDTDQMSAAGQMETFLGIQGLEQIYSAIKKCWASQFGYIAVEYKRQNGQLLNSPMAVVVQEMVECESAGVLFTCEPVTNNPSVIVITCNYGLGESVVSGSEEPDVIILQKISETGVKIKDICIGLKQRKIVIAASNSSEENGTVVLEVPEKEQSECCISEETAIKLGKLSLKIEKHFKSPRDIEWGMKNNQIFILQSRPITTGESVSDFEIMREFEGPLRSEDDFFTTCNVGEVMPGAVSTLGFDILTKVFGVCFMKKYRREVANNYYAQNKYFANGMPTFYNHVFMGVVDLCTFMSEDTDSLASQGIMISVFGRILDDPMIKEKVKQRRYSPPKFKYKAIYQYLWSLFFSLNGLEKYKENIFKYETPALKCKTANQIFKELMTFCSHTCKPAIRHSDVSCASSSWNMYLFSVLANAKGVIDNDVYNDFAKLLASSTNVESADVPSAMQILAQAIIKDIESGKFKEMSVEDAQQWLKTSTSEAGIKYREFIKRHGHRCLKELDIHTIPWSVDPKPLIKLLQSMVGCCEEHQSKEEKDFSYILPQLKTSFNFKSRLLLRFLLFYCRKGIRGREICKSILVKTFDNVRKGFRHLSEAMVAEGFLPDGELVFFMTTDEIKTLLENRSPRIISRAKHRRKLFPFLDSLQFPAIVKGRPVPLNEHPEEELNYETDLIMKGIPVSQGTVKGNARVALTLTEASDLKPGEILITHSTDIAWSPYFPILGGVVTELGGLISHGAVVSREYGLPCVVGLHGATKQFKTGDYVLLDGNKGILQRLSCVETTDCSLVI